MENEETQIAKAEPKWTVQIALETQRSEFEAALNGAIKTDQFMRLCATAWLAGGPQLQKANWPSFVFACVEAAQLGLKPGNILGECYILGAKDKWKGPGLWASLRIGYRGMMKLARRGGAVNDMNPEVVYENDDFRETKGTSRGLHHVPWYDPSVGAKEPGEIILAYSTARMRDGHVSFHVVERAFIDRAAAKSGKPWEDKASNVWQEHFEAMAMKTAIRRHCKFLPLPEEAKHAIIRDEYRDMGVPEGSITVISEEDKMIAELRQDPKEIERKALGKAKTTEARQATGLVAATRKRLWNSDAGERFFKAAGCSRDTGNVDKFIKFATDSDATGDIEVLKAAQDFLVQWVTEPNAEEAEETVSKFAKIVSGEAQGDRNADGAFESSLEGKA